MKLLRISPTLRSTTASYNQFSLGFKEIIDQTFCSLHKPQLAIINKKIKIYHGNNSIIKLIKIIKRLVDTNNYDLVHIHNGLTGFAFLLAIFPFKLFLLNKTIFTLHNSWDVFKLRNQFLNLIIMIFSKKICVCSQSSRNSIPKIFNYFLNKKTQTIVNGFNHQRIDNIRSKKLNDIHFDKNSHIKIVYVGALNNVKNQIALLEVLRSMSIDSELIFIGDGFNKKTLIDYSRNIHSNTKIKFKGLLSRELAIEHMLEADVSISLSKGEGLPIAVLETLYAGCFQILSKIPPHEEILPPSSRCIFVDQSNKLQIENSLNFIKNNISLIRAQKPVSQEYLINNFGTGRMLKEYKKVYDSLLGINS